MSTVAASLVIIKPMQQTLQVSRFFSTDCQTVCSLQANQQDIHYISQDKSALANFC